MGDESGEKLVGVEGDVKWFDSKKGFGFIVGPEGQDVFIHYTQRSEERRVGKECRSRWSPYH